MFAIDDQVGQGLPLWLPNGTVIRDELEKLAKELEFKAGYKRVATPVIAEDGALLPVRPPPLLRRAHVPVHGAGQGGREGEEKLARSTCCGR